VDSIRTDGLIQRVGLCVGRHIAAVVRTLGHLFGQPEGQGRQARRTCGRACAAAVRWGRMLHNRSLRRGAGGGCCGTRSELDGTRLVERMGLRFPIG